MTDPISVTASIIGITAAGIKLSRELYTICDTIGSSQAQIEDLACDLASFTSIVNELEAIFKSPKPIHSDALKKSLSDVLDKCRSLFQKINRMIGRTESEGESTVRLKTRVAWVFRETKVRPIRASLESTKQTLGLMLHTLKFAADELKDDQRERQILANLLRSQQRSLEVLLKLEEAAGKQQSTARPNQSGDDVQSNPAAAPSLAESLRSAMPPALPRANGDQTAMLNGYRPLFERSHNPYGNISTTTAATSDRFTRPDSPHLASASTSPADPRSATPTDWRSNSSLSQHFSETNLKSLYPIWKERVLDNVDTLLQAWTQIDIPVHELPGDSAVPPRPKLSDEEIKAAEKKRDSLAQQLEEFARRQNIISGDSKQFSDRRKNIEDRLQKRNNGWLEINDVALQRLEKEVELLLSKEADCAKRIGEYKTESTALTIEMDKVLDAIRLASVESSSMDDQPQSSTPAIATSMPSSHMARPSAQSSNIDVTPQWLKEGQRFNDDSDAEEQDNLPSDTTDQYQKPPTQVEPATDDSHPKIDNIMCIRQAFKPPQAYRGGLDIFSHVLNLARYPPLWFTASQDVYKFHLGKTKQCFYVIEMTPPDLSSSNSSRVEWTVIGKPWAHPKALKTMGWSYYEDSVGYMWIEKELSSYDIGKISELSCDLLDRALAVSSRDIMRKRSTDNETGKQRVFLNSMFSPEPRKSDTLFDHHSAFFHDNDIDVRKRNKSRADRANFMRSSS